MEARVCFASLLGLSLEFRFFSHELFESEVLLFGADGDLGELGLLLSHFFLQMRRFFLIFIDLR